MEKETIKDQLDNFYQNREFTKYVNYFLNNRQQLELLLNISLQPEEGKYCLHGTWICAHIADQDPTVFYSSLKSILYFVKTEKHPTSVRNWMKVLTFLDIPEELEGEIIERCTQFISDSNCKVALQMYSMYILLPLVKKYTELIPEITELIDLHSIGKSPAYHAVSRKFKKALKNYGS